MINYKKLFVLYFSLSVSLNIGNLSYSKSHDDLYSFSDKMMHRGYFNSSGKVVIPSQFIDAKSFSEGLGAVKDSEINLWGFINKSGKYIIQPKYFKAEAFSDGMSMVETKDGLSHYIDKKGNILSLGFGIEPYKNYSMGLAVISQSINGKRGYGFINKSGKIVINAVYEYANQFSDGLAAVHDKQSNKWGYIDTKGKMVIPPSFSEALKFSNGLAPVRISSTDKWGFINKKGTFAIQPKFSEVKEFSDGLALAKPDSSTNFGFINTKGNFVIKNDFPQAESFNSGLAAVWEMGKYVYINKSGKIIFDPDMKGTNSVAFRTEREKYVKEIRDKKYTLEQMSDIAKEAMQNKNYNKAIVFYQESGAPKDGDRAYLGFCLMAVGDYNLAKNEFEMEKRFSQNPQIKSYSDKMLKELAGLTN